MMEIYPQARKGKYRVVCIGVTAKAVVVVVVMTNSCSPINRPIGSKQRLLTRAPPSVELLATKRLGAAEKWSSRRFAPLDETRCNANTGLSPPVIISGMDTSTTVDRLPPAQPCPEVVQPEVFTAANGCASERDKSA
ncbi:unnamed protein product [Soboliphyme baturini]|uniref:Uncharacterized protein n=1 Tax=Soboliphyme baturini TaxID=241478 RepID=A0A183ICC5_9BILA|nr:unnamed protein product [Soboliphyme baturini]